MKNNKKGFTLAELLIVIAIIAILIAIAIPAFGSSLDNARLQTDHANMRSAYAMVQVANLQGIVEVDGTESKLTAFTGPAYFGADGSITATNTNAYVTLVKPSDSSKCASSAFCTSGGNGGTAITHEKEKWITFTKDATSGELYLSLTAAPASP